MASFGGSIKLTGADEYKNALKQISQSLRETGSELTAVASRYDKNDSSLSTLKAKTTELSGVLAKQVQAYNNLKGSYDTFSAKVSQQTQAHDKLVQTYEKEKQELENIRKASGESSQAFQDQQAKVNDLASAVAKSSQNMNENQIALSKMKTQLNQAEATVNKTAKEIDELGNETEESGEKAKKGSEGYTVFKNILANLGTQAINSALNGLKNLGSTVAGVGKQALASYGEYEQLVGGVESMFGGTEKGAEQINKVLDLSEKAWQDLTMSQNDYITAFNSTYPLMKNDIEDQNEAIEKTNRIMTLNSDLANTFGYSMEEASNAVNWALKGTFSYLDNLNIGIKGTKEGFLEAAKSVGYTVKSVDELSSSDILDILEKCADRYGVLGKTADEAGRTIQGSVNAMKSAWSNLVTGMADSNANIEDLVRNLMLTIAGDGTENNLGVLGNVMPAVENISKGIMNALPQLLNGIISILPQFLDAGVNIINGLVNGIQQNMPAIMSATMQIINTLLTTIINNLPKILQMGIQVIVSLIQGIAQQLPTLIPQMVETVLTMADTLIDNIDLIIDAGIQLIIGLAEGLIEALPQLIDKIPIIIDKLVTAIVNNLPKLIEMGITLIVKLAEGLIKAIPQLVSKIPQIISSLVNGIASYYSKIFSIGGELLKKVKDGIVNGIGSLLDVGKNIVQGLWNGINNAKDWLLGKIKGFGKSVLNGIKSVFGIHSPSTVFRDQVGKNLALGIGEGFTDEMANVTSEMQNAIPTSFDTDLNVGSGSASGSSNYYSMVDAFKQALSEMKIELDDEVAGRFVETTVANAIYN